MKSLAIIEPITPTAIASAATTPANLLTPNPKEVISFAPGNVAVNVDVDLGAVYSVDSFFLGFLSPLLGGNFAQTGDGPRIAISGGAAGYADAVLAANFNPFVTTATGVASPIERHSFTQLAAAVNARYIRFAVTSETAGINFTAGALAIGKAWQTTWGHEWGAGRPIEDTSDVERLFGGGFGINEGSTAGGYQWTFGDLTDQEVRDLYAMARRLGVHKSCVVVEDPDNATVGLNERTHWGLFDKLEPYERLTVGATKWAFKIRDWA